MRRIQLFFWIIIIFCSTLLIRCNDNGQFNAKKNTLDQPDLTSEEIKRLVLLDTNYAYPAAAARQDAITVAAELDAEDGKKGRNIHRTIAETITISIQDTIRYPKTDRSRKNDPGFHIFNFANNNGFAIISGDKRAFGRLGWAEKGIVNGDSKINMFLSRAVRYLQSKRQEAEAMRGDKDYISLLMKLANFKSKGISDKNNSSGRIECAPPNSRTSQTAPISCSSQTTSTLVSTTNAIQTIVPALLKTAWNQNAPYNNNYGGSECGTRYDDCYLHANNNYFAGCTEIAEAQVIAYFYGKNPAKYGTDWPIISNTNLACTLNSNQVSLVAGLVRQVYSNYNFTVHSCVFSSSSNANGTFTFPYPDNGISSTFGLVQGEWRSYNNGDLEASLMNGSPVPVYGTEHLLCLCVGLYIPFVGCAGYNACVGDPTVYHEWVIDGLQRVVTTSTYLINPIDYCTCNPLPSYYASYATITNSYTHYNWGWGGDSNGWYIEGSFGGPDTSGNYNVHSFNHDDNIIAYITPL